MEVLTGFKKVIVTTDYWGNTCQNNNKISHLSKNNPNKIEDNQHCQHTADDTIVHQVFMNNM